VPPGGEGGEFSRASGRCLRAAILRAAAQNHRRLGARPRPGQNWIGTPSLRYFSIISFASVSVCSSRTAASLRFRNKSGLVSN